MSKEQTAIGPQLLWPLLLVSALGYGLLNLPRYSANILGAEAYLAVPVAAVLILPALAAIYLLARRFEGKTLIEQGGIVLGPTLGRITGAIYLSVIILLLTMSTRDIADLVGTYFLDRTPLWFIVLSFLAVAAYLASRGLETVARLACFLLIPAIAVMVLLGVGGLQNLAATRILPVQATFPNLLRGGMSEVSIYYALAGTAVVLPMVKPLKSFPRTAGWTVLALAVVFSLFALGAIGVFGHDYLAQWTWPCMEFVHVMEYPFLLLEQAGLLMLIDWIAMILAGTGFLYYIIALGAAQLSGTLDYKHWVLILLPVQFAAMIWPRNSLQVKAAFEYIERFGWTALFAYPVALLSIAMILGRKGGHTDAP